MKILVPHLVAAVALLSLMILYPGSTISPGDLAEGHKKLNDDCLACHAPLRGPQARKCLACHPAGKIGILTVSGEPRKAANPLIPFHQALIKTDCMSCHSEHTGRGARRITRKFSHGLLKAPLAENCQKCHQGQAPDNPLHRGIAMECSRCHTIQGWKGARFDHQQFRTVVDDRCRKCHSQDIPPDLLHRQISAECGACHSFEKWKDARFDHQRLKPSFKEQCADCHSGIIPRDQLHRQIESNCQACHSTSHWRPANFDHDRYFRFDRHHPADCRSCHTDRRNFKQYTCYRCHEHSQAKIARKHRKERIWDFQDCAKCHRSGDEDDAKRLWKKEHRRGRDDDD